MDKHYQGIDWKNGLEGGTRINQTNLNKVDAGIIAVDDALCGLSDRVDGINTKDPTYASVKLISNSSNKNTTYSQQTIERREGSVLKTHIELPDKSGTLLVDNDIKPNPSGSATADLNKVEIQGTVYNVVGSGGGTEVVANPTEDATDTLHKLKVDSTVFDIESGGIDANVEIIGGKNTLVLSGSSGGTIENDILTVGVGTLTTPFTRIPTKAKKLIIVAGQQNFDEFEGVAVIDLVEKTISGVSHEEEIEWFNKTIYSTMDTAQDKDTFTKSTDKDEYKYYWKDSNGSNYGTVTITILGGLGFTTLGSYSLNTHIIYWE